MASSGCGGGSCRTLLITAARNGGRQVIAEVILWIAPDSPQFHSQSTYLVRQASARKTIIFGEFMRVVIAGLNGLSGFANKDTVVGGNEEFR
jgi:hypothetical protein